MGGSRRGDGARRYAGGVQHFDLLCERASDARWRIREAVAMGLLAYGQADPEGVLALMAEFRVLRNGLAYGWSVGVVAYPELGKGWCGGLPRTMPMLAGS